MPEIILASGSRTRQRMLRDAGIDFSVRPAAVDEPAIRADLLAREPGAGSDRIALTLAEAKAAAVGWLEPAALVIGSDQVLAVGDDTLHKPVDRADARASLLRLRGATHALHSAVAVAEHGRVVWRHVAIAHLTMRAFGAPFLETYLDQAGDAVLSSVGAYQLEGPGIQLFERLEGDYFTILGMPLLPLLAELRRRGLLGA